MDAIRPVPQPSPPRVHYLEEFDRAIATLLPCLDPVIVGGTNTAITLIIYQILLLALPYRAAYTISYISGIPIALMVTTASLLTSPLKVWPAVDKAS